MGYLDNAVATTRGWTHPKTGELLKSQRMSQGEADAHNGIVPVVEAPIVEEVEVEEVVQQLNEAPANNKSLEEMNKVELEALGRTKGVELDRRQSKSSLLGQMKSLIKE